MSAPFSTSSLGNVAQLRLGAQQARIGISALDGLGAQPDSFSRTLENRMNTPEPAPRKPESAPGTAAARAHGDSRAHTRARAYRRQGPRQGRESGRGRRRQAGAEGWLRLQASGLRSFRVHGGRPRAESDAAAEGTTATTQAGAPKAARTRDDRRRPWRARQATPRGSPRWPRPPQPRRTKPPRTSRRQARPPTRQRLPACRQRLPRCWPGGRSAFHARTRPPLRPARLSSPLTADASRFRIPPCCRKPSYRPSPAAAPGPAPIPLRPSSSRAASLPLRPGGTQRNRRGSRGHAGDALEQRRHDRQPAGRAGAHARRDAPAAPGIHRAGRLAAAPGGDRPASRAGRKTSAIRCAGCSVAPKARRNWC